MIYEASFAAVAVFSAFVAFTLGLSFYFARKTKSAQSYFAAGGQIHWFVNGVAFAGDYLSAASFLGICGMIAFYGYDGFLYSIGYLAGWVVALFVVAEPLKRLGKFTFADALAAKFNSPGIKLAAGISTLVVSLFYLIPQMVGAGALVKPLLGFGHATGVCLVGAVVVLIVVTAGMVSTTYVQFLKGSLLVVFSTILTVAILNRGLNVTPRNSAIPEYQTSQAPNVPSSPDIRPRILEHNNSLSRFRDRGKGSNSSIGLDYFRNPKTGRTDAYRSWLPIDLGEDRENIPVYIECQSIKTDKDGRKLVNGYVQGKNEGEGDLFPVGNIVRLPGNVTSTGPLGPLEFIRTIRESTILLWYEYPDKLTEPDGTTTYYAARPVKGGDILTAGQSPTFAGLRIPTENWTSGSTPRAIPVSWTTRLKRNLNFLSLMLALFLGTASLPHILIRYYTVKDQAAARKSTVVGIASIGFFYVLTLYIGLGAMTGGTLDVTNSNMAAPLLAKSFGELLFACISAIAFTTVLGTVAGLIVAAAGAVVHDLVTGFFKVELTDHEKVRVGKLGSIVVGVIAIVLGILFEKMNVTFLVGWAFSVAASANMPSLAMLLFWKGTTKQGIIAGILVGMISSLTWVLLSADAFKDVYGLSPDKALVPFSQPGIVTIPLGFATVVLVSLMTRSKSPAV
ncbi:MAG: cation acetate symporter [Planctomycetes bacterium]|nr:cation acetate symporter [Planctomycetota bacterium]